MGVTTWGHSSLYHLLDQSRLVAAGLLHITNAYNGSLKNERQKTKMRDNFNISSCF